MITAHFGKYRHIYYMIMFLLFYILCFFWLEQKNTEIHIIHCPIDDKIPFCEYFIIPYVLWYPFLGAVILYFALFCKEYSEFKRLAWSFCTGMVVFVIISLVYPNGHDLRPTTMASNLFTAAVKMLHKIDTSTNILPSLHVYEAVVCCVAILHNKECRNRGWLIAGSIVLTVSIIMSTMFLKQHSVVDVVTALGLNVICYVLFYVR